MPKLALVPLFIQLASADFACAAANKFAGDWFYSVRVGGLCLCSREFIRREYSPGLVIRLGLISPLFLVRRGRRYPVQSRLTIAGDSRELAQDN
ncbi:hypothetical protein E5S67_00696 [Microcoleus sp. IPMA8]|uniref:Uncharacterized protein n=1 Tax=Microcoleus asticus IPMA8 TaxID=2563858 RepID=A0ABX2CRD4_9CYAN|nr:hypothetical protein [Microcoleus asticus IPMA8]